MTKRGSTPPASSTARTDGQAALSTTTIYLVRHAAHGLLERVLTGRMPQVHLADLGHAQARRLARHFAGLSITAIQTSPRERAEETARPIARAANLPCDIVDALDEIDIGAWTGRAFADLAGDPDWQAWNSRRSIARAPGGESMAEVQARMLAHLQAIPARHPEGRVVMVSHADVIKAVLLHVLGASLDAFASFDIAPASISTLLLGDWGGRIVALNERVAAA